MKWNYYDEIINYEEQFQFTFSQRYTLKIKYYLDRIKQKFLVLKIRSLYKAQPNDPLAKIFQKNMIPISSQKKMKILN